MGNSCGCDNTSYFGHQTFSSINEYISTARKNDDDVQRILEKIAPGSSSTHHKNIAAYVSEQNGTVFNDPNFIKMEKEKSLEVSALSKMYNFNKFGLDRVFKKNERTSMSIFDQKEVELSYLDSVFYLICRENELKEQIFITEEVNKHKVYIINLFCNGHENDVVVDENVPTLFQNIKYLSVRTPGELWPFLLEKAWCKQIGGYDKARGLSPEDCFEEITGIPATSYQLKKNNSHENWELLRKSFNERYWITLTANENETNEWLKSRQVFYLESLNESMKTFKLRSPFTKFDFPSKRSDEGVIELAIDELISNFDFATIGAYTPRFVPSSLEFSSEKDEELIFEISIKAKVKFNLRVIQFYSEYLNEIDKQTYEYSSVLMELFDSKMKFIENSSGTLGSYSKSRSSRIFYENVEISDTFFNELYPGTYYLRVQVSWLNQAIKNSACIVSYAPQNSFSIKKYEKETFNFCARILENNLDATKKFTNEEQAISVRYIEKKNGYILGIMNTSNLNSQLKVYFKKSENIAINHYHLKDNILVIKLEALEERVLEILPNDPTAPYVLDSFEISRN